MTEASSSKDDTPVELKHARLIYQQAYKHIKDVNFIIELLDIASKYKDTKDLQKIIMNNLVENFSDEPIMWDTWARREFKGLSYSSDQDDDSLGGKSKKKTLRDRLNSAIEVYESAVKLLPTKTMWSLYINFLLEINKDNSTLPNYKRKLLKAALTQGHEEKNLEEKYYWFWVRN